MAYALGQFTDESLMISFEIGAGFKREDLLGYVGLKQRHSPIINIFFTSS